MEVSYRAESGVGRLQPRQCHHVRGTLRSKVRRTTAAANRIERRRLRMSHGQGPVENESSDIFDSHQHRRRLRYGGHNRTANRAGHQRRGYPVQSLLDLADARPKRFSVLHNPPKLDPPTGLALVANCGRWRTPTRRKRTTAARSHSDSLLQHFTGIVGARVTAMTLSTEPPDPSPDSVGREGYSSRSGPTEDHWEQRITMCRCSARQSSFAFAQRPFGSLFRHAGLSSGN